MEKTLIYLLSGWAVFSIGSTLVAAPEQAQRPGDISPPIVWVQNRGADEAIPVNIQDAGSGPPFRVQVTGAVSTRPQRQSWEYSQVRIASDQDAVAVLNNAGTDGWETTGFEIASGGAVVVVLKRPR